MLTKILVLLVGLGWFMAGCSGAAIDKQYSVQFSGMHGEGIAHLRIVRGGRELEGLFVCKDNFAEEELIADPGLLALCAELNWGIVYLRPAGFGLTLDVPRGEDAVLQGVFDRLADESGMPNLANLPFVTFGHSASGPWAQQLAYAFPERVIAVVHFKSGNLLNFRPKWRIRDAAHIPMLVISGESEEFGPNGLLDKDDSKESQWLALRDDLRQLRENGYRAAQAVLPGEGHYAWSDAAARIMIPFLREVWELRERGALDGDTDYLVSSDPKSAEAGTTQWWLPGLRTAEAWREVHQGYGRRGQEVWFEGRTNKPDGVDHLFSGWDSERRILTVTAQSGSGGAIQYRLLRGAAVQTGPQTFEVSADKLNQADVKPVLLILAVQGGDAQWSRAERVGRFVVPAR